MSIQEYRKSIIETSTKQESESVYDSVVDKYGDDLLSYNGFPKAYFDFFIELMSEKVFYTKAGLWNFPLFMSTESHRLSLHHYDIIEKTIIENFKFYTDETLCFAVCDFVARNYPAKKAEKILITLERIEFKKSKKGFAAEGFFILEQERKRSDN